MPAKRELTMRQLRYMLRLHHDGVSAREIGRTLGVARSTIQDNLRRAQAIGIAWPVPAELTDDMLEQRLFARAGVKVGLRRRSEPDWATLARELKRPGVSLMVLWEEYRQSERDGYGYSRFCDLFREFERRLSPVMRQHHVAGDKVFVDYSGKRIAIVDPGTGVVHDAEIFVGVLGASSYSYAEATFTQTLPDWIGAHVRMFRFFGGVPRLIVPDNLKSGVHKASFYDPEINRSYGMMAAHYGVGVLPARPRKPRDKAKVEVGVRFAQSYILGRLRHQTFFSLAECNTAIASCLDRMNAHVMRRLGVSRRDLFERIERPALRALPAQHYEYAEWRLTRVGLPPSLSRAATGAMPNCCARSAGSNSSSSMIGARRSSRPTRPATCSKSSRIATTPARSLSPVKRPSTAGMRSSAIPRLPMPSSTASFTMPTGSSSLARACANGVCSNHPLDPASKGKHHPNDPQRRAARWPTSDRNPGRLRIGTGGRLHIGMHGRLRRNPHATP